MKRQNLKMFRYVILRVQSNMRTKEKERKKEKKNKVNDIPKIQVTAAVHIEKE